MAYRSRPIHGSWLTLKISTYILYHQMKGIATYFGKKLFFFGSCLVSFLGKGGIFSASSQTISISYTARVSFSLYNTFPILMNYIVDQTKEKRRRKEMCHHFIIWLAMAKGPDFHAKSKKRFILELLVMEPWPRAYRTPFMMKTQGAGSSMVQWR